MQTNEKIIEFGKKLPHGSQTRIAKAIGLTPITVNKFLKTGKGSHDTAIKILKAAQPFYKAALELEKAKKDLIDAMIIE